MQPHPGADILILSPHIDDGVLSLGGFIATATAAGKKVRILTIFGGDPDSTEEAGRWDRRVGFATTAERDGAKRR